MSNWKNQKKKIKDRFKAAGLPIPTAEEIKIMLSEGLITYGAQIATTLGCTPTPCFGIKYSDPYMVCKEEGNNPMTNVSANATVNTKTDLQVQREYLLKRWNEVESSLRYGTISSKMTDAFNLHVDNKPNTSKELIDGITSGKFKLDPKKAALQDVAVARDEPFYDEDDNYTGSPFYAIDFGGATPDRLGYENARDDFTNKLKLLKDQIMTGDPAASATALQALEAWTPPTATAAN